MQAIRGCVESDINGTVPASKARSTPLRSTPLIDIAALDQCPGDGRTWLEGIGWAVGNCHRALHGAAAWER